MRLHLTISFRSSFIYKGLSCQYRILWCFGENGLHQLKTSLARKRYGFYDVLFFHGVPQMLVKILIERIFQKHVQYTQYMQDIQENRDRPKIA